MPTAPARFTPPPPLHPDRPRVRLEAQLECASPAPVLMLLAPGGYGKSCGVRAWWSRLTRPRAWLVVPPEGRLNSAEVASACAAASAGWLVVDGVERLEGESASVLVAQVEAAQPEAPRWIFIGRYGRTLPITRWRSEGRADLLDGRALALDEGEWSAEGLPGHAEAWAGWWGACLASSPAGEEDAELERWLCGAWLDHLEPSQLAEIGGLSLFEQVTEETAAPLLAAWLGRGPSEAKALWSRTRAQPLPVLLAGDGVRLAPRLRLHVQRVWRARQPGVWAEVVDRAVPGLLDQGMLESAARVALESERSELRASVLKRAGWRLLYRADRAWLRALLDRQTPRERQPSSEMDDVALLEVAWQAEAVYLPHRAETMLASLRCPEEAAEGEAKALTLRARHALRASIAWQFDEIEGARVEASAALAAQNGDLHPSAILAHVFLGNSLLYEGRMAEAERELRQALGGAVRDELPRAQLEAWHGLALLAWEREDEEGLLSALREIHQILATTAPVAPNLRSCDSTARLEAACALRRLDGEGVRAALAAGAPEGSRYGADESLPHRNLRAMLAWVDGDDPELERQVVWIETRLRQRFNCLKWRMESLLPRIAWRTRRVDSEGLLRLAEEVEREFWPAGVTRDHRDLILAGARLLAGRTVDAAKLTRRAREGRAAGMVALARRAELLAALADGNDEELLACVRESAVTGARLDFLWLAPRVLAGLERLLTRPALAHDARTRSFLRELVQRLLHPGAVAKSSTGPRSPPPADLTEREWEILRLIGEQFTNDQIAARLFVSVATVKTHINRVYGKLGIGSRSEAILRARTLEKSAR